MTAQIDVATLQTGGVFVVYDDSLEIRGQIFDVSGVAVTEEFQINTHIQSKQTAPTIAALADGSFVVFWESLLQDGDEGGIYGQKFDAAGAKIGVEFQVNQATAGDQKAIFIEATADGSFTVMWFEEVGGATNVVARDFDASGAPVGSAAIVAALGDVEEVGKLARLQDGGFVNVFTDRISSSQHNIFVQVYDETGSEVGGPMRIPGSSFFLNSDEFVRVTAVKMAEDGRLILTWQETVLLGSFGSNDFVHSVIFDPANGTSVPISLTGQFTALHVLKAGFAIGEAGELVYSVQGADEAFDNSGFSFLTDIRIETATIDINLRPVATAAGAVPITVAEDDVVLIALADLIRDPDDDVDDLTFTVEGLPGEFSFDGAAITGAPSQASVGTHALTITATDPLGESLELTTTLVVQNVNDAPVLTGAGVASLSFAEAEQISLDVAVLFEDEDGDALVFAATGLPPGLELSGATIIGGVNLGSAGAYAIEVIATDPDGEAITAAFTLDIASLIPTLGTPGPDIFAAGADPVAYDGLGGDDDITGSAAADVLSGGAGDDVIRGAGGADQIDGGIGADDLSGDAGDDLIAGRSDDDILFGGDGADALHGNSGDDILNGGEGDDLLNGGASRDRATYETAAAGIVVNLVGGTAEDGDGGSDTLVGIEDVFGSHFADSVTADAGANLLAGRSGDDLLFGLAGDDELHGNSGDDILNGGEGDDFLNGGAGEDTASYASAGPVVANLSSGRVDEGLAGEDRLVGIENLSGSAFADVLIGNAGRNTLIGAAGDDRLNGRGGADKMIGGDGNDIYYVDDFDDLVIETADGGMDRVNVMSDWASVAGVELVVGAFAEQGLTLDGHDGEDRIIGANKINSPDLIRGNGGADRLVGLNGDDRIFGGDGDDRIFGNSGDDVINGGAGVDSLTGQFGNDTFVLKRGDGVDHITDFNQRGDDVIDLTDFTTDFATIDRLITFVGNDLHIDLLNGDGIVLENIGLAPINIQDFIF